MRGCSGFELLALLCCVPELNSRGNGLAQIVTGCVDEVSKGNKKHKTIVLDKGAWRQDMDKTAF